MGYSVSWLAVRGKAPNIVQAQLGLRETGKRVEGNWSPVVGADLPGGWYLVFVNRFDSPLFRKDVLARLSSGAEVVTCAVEEHVMCSTASGWKDGRETWSLLHESDQGIDHLKASGSLPVIFDTVRERLMAEQEAVEEQDDVDFIFDIPVEIAHQLTGFRHDLVIPEMGEEPFRGPGAQVKPSPEP